jgi:hypothetical protein
LVDQIVEAILPLEKGPIMICDTFRYTALSIVIGFVTLSVDCVSAIAQEYRLCIGEYPQKCPVKYDQYSYCGASADVVAAKICRAMKYRLVHLGTQGGNKCGYEWYLVECLNN